MKKLLSVVLIFTMLVSTLGFSFADSSNNAQVTLNRNLSIMSNELKSNPVPLNDGSFFIQDNRPETLNKVNRENRAAKSNGTISPLSNGVIQYGYVIKTQSVPSPSGHTCTVQSTSYVKAIFEYSVYRFLECQSVNWTAYGSSFYSVNPTNGNYNISGSGRYLNIAGAFNVETSISISAGPSFGAAGWSVGASVGGNVIVRKWVIKEFTFDGDYPGALLN